MRLFDLHCDTLYRAVCENKSLFEPSFQLSLDRGNDFSEWIQCLAIWIPDNLDSDSAFKLFESAHRKLKSELQNIKGIKIPSIIFTVENGSLIGDELDRADKIADAGVKILTLTWNGPNTIGGGSQCDYGITKFGKKVVERLEKLGIVIDVSHASDKLFYDVSVIARRPFIATHSNSRSCTPHKRNLTDEQFKIIRDIGGIVGINFCDIFLNEIPENASIKDIIRHTEYFLSLGGEDTLSIGSDFDGCDIPHDIESIDGVLKIYNEFLRLNYSETLLDKIFFKNAYNFFKNYFDISTIIM